MRRKERRITNPAHVGMVRSSKRGQKVAGGEIKYFEYHDFGRRKVNEEIDPPKGMKERRVGPARVIVEQKNPRLGPNTPPEGRGIRHSVVITDRRMQTLRKENIPFTRKPRPKKRRK
ncbi:MAG: hypothetical protein NUV67_00440 [archaeon]|nr:hypothetical protein [archaeon]